MGARPALFMVWPDITRIEFIDACRDSYRLAADTVGGVSMPAETVRAIQSAVHGVNQQYPVR